MTDDFKEVLLFFPEPIRSALRVVLHNNHGKLEEIRLRVRRPLAVGIEGKDYYVSKDGKINTSSPMIITKSQIESAKQLLFNYSYYSVEEELKNGFVTVKGGHRVGVIGKAVMQKGEIKTLKEISGLNFRIARQVSNLASKVMPYVFESGSFLNTMIISPPNCGKTTLLRDMVRSLSDDFKFKVGVVDERSEIAACYQGQPQLDVGNRTDVLDGCPKDEGMTLMIRSMSPDIIATDELGREQDVVGVEHAITCGVGLLTTVHGLNLKDLMDKRWVKEVLDLDYFKRLIILSRTNGVGTVEEIIDLRTSKKLTGGVKNVKGYGGGSFNSGNNKLRVSKGPKITTTYYSS
ncbi:stage III sporulation protein AA [Proteinivorax hydrogeniformans]|uniref:Stage III sporulation protein AA n=1 Tax=Proteinivorax hydrogeniformans TaxID=1826727 RepID=A0AAU8HQJ2_9FIRM